MMYAFIYLFLIWPVLAAVYLLLDKPVTTFLSRRGFTPAQVKKLFKYYFFGHAFTAIIGFSTQLIFYFFHNVVMLVLVISVTALVPTALLHLILTKLSEKPNTARIPPDEETAKALAALKELRLDDEISASEYLKRRDKILYKQ